MIKVSSNFNKIVSIKRHFRENGDDVIIDSFLIIPGVTIYNSIYQRSNTLVFVEQTGNSLLVEFLTEGDVERYYTQLLRDTKLNQLMNNVDPKRNN